MAASDKASEGGAAEEKYASEEPMEIAGTTSDPPKEAGGEKEAAIADKESASAEQETSDTKQDPALVGEASAGMQYADVLGLTLYQISSLMALLTFFILFVSFGNLCQRHDYFLTVIAKVNADREAASSLSRREASSLCRGTA